MKKLNHEELAKVQGGGYCETLQLITNNNCLSSGAAGGAIYGYLYAGCSFSMTITLC